LVIEIPLRIKHFISSKTYVMRKLLYPILSVVMAFWYSCTSPLEGVTLQLPRALSQSNIIIEYQPENLSEDEKLTNANVVIGGQIQQK
jgi:hypothetical protein